MNIPTPAVWFAMALATLHTGTAPTVCVRTLTDAQSREALQEASTDPRTFDHRDGVYVRL